MAGSIPDTLEIKASAIHGVGLFSKVAFEIGEWVFSGKRELKKIENPDKPIGEICGHSIVPSIHCPRVRDDLYHVYGFDSFMNHSCDPNTSVVYVNDYDYYHIATRAIEVGEELTVDYRCVYEDECMIPNN